METGKKTNGSSESDAVNPTDERKRFKKKIYNLEEKRTSHIFNKEMHFTS